MIRHSARRHARREGDGRLRRGPSSLALIAVAFGIFFCVQNLALAPAQIASPRPQSSDRLDPAPGQQIDPEPKAQYVGDDACRSCHGAQADTYRDSAHRATSSLPSATSIHAHFTPTSNVLATSNQYLYFLMQSRGEEFSQTAVIDLPLSERISRTERIDIVVGSGRKGQTYLSWTGDQLFELPVSYWAEGNRWINSPGYIDGLPNFDKVILPRCLECHATSMQSLAPPANRFNRSDVKLGIGCERCHGPGREHVILESSGLPLGPNANKAIYNPASSSRDRQMSLCSLCHAGPGNPLQPSFSFSPGDDIRKFIALPALPANQALDVHGSQVQLLESSRCFKGSQMTCTTCHDVHRQQRDAASFSGTCLSCHKAESCGEYRTLGQRIAEDCVSCHMPLQRTEQIVFDDNGTPVKPSIRNHRIAVYAKSSAPLSAGPSASLNPH